ncbi:hypothetical protein QBC39DRAFT_123938 [Podospora conica]|nr:hypothetical protein QBC39DRAFT_123938 [Schizothecium conicum]
MGMPRFGTGCPFPAFSQHPPGHANGSTEEEVPPITAERAKARSSDASGTRLTVIRWPAPPLFASSPFSRETTRVTVTPARRPSFPSPIFYQSIRLSRYQLVCLAPPSRVNTVLLRPRDRPRPTTPSRVRCVCDFVQVHTRVVVLVARGRGRVGAARLGGLSPSPTLDFFDSATPTSLPHLRNTSRDMGFLAPPQAGLADKTIRPLRHVGLTEVNITQRTERYTTTPSCTVSRPGPLREAACPGSKASC